MSEGKMIGEELHDSTKAFSIISHRSIIRRVTNVTDNAPINAVKVREIHEELLTPVTTKILIP